MNHLGSAKAFHVLTARGCVVFSELIFFLCLVLEGCNSCGSGFQPPGPICAGPCFWGNCLTRNPDPKVRLSVTPTKASFRPTEEISISVTIKNKRVSTIHVPVALEGGYFRLCVVGPDDVERRVCNVYVDPPPAGMTVPAGQSAERVLNLGKWLHDFSAGPRRLKAVFEGPIFYDDTEQEEIRLECPESSFTIEKANDEDIRKIEGWVQSMNFGDAYRAYTFLDTVTVADFEPRLTDCAIQLSRHTDEAIRGFSLTLLAARRCSKCLDRLLEMASSDDDLRAYAIQRGLAFYFDEDSVKLKLRDLSSDSNSYVRQVVMEVWFEKRKQEAAEDICRFLTDTDDENRRQAIEYLKRLEYKPALDKVIELYGKETSPTVKQEAENYFHAIGRDDLVPTGE